MVSIDEDVSPASIPTTYTYTWSDVRSSGDTERFDDKLIKFNQSSTFRFERTEEEFDASTQKTIKLRIKYTNSSYHWCCLGVAWENNLKGDKGLYYFDKSIMYSSYYPKVTINHSDLTYKKFTVNNNDLVSINFDPENMKISYEHNDEDLGEISIPDNNIVDNWYFIVGMFVGEIEIVD